MSLPFEPRIEDHRLLTGTGRFLDFCKQVWPRLPVLGLDMSEAYVAEARRHLRQWCWIDFVVANGEAIPVESASQDAVTSIFTFHELPPKVRVTIGESIHGSFVARAQLVLDGAQDLFGILNIDEAHQREAQRLYRHRGRTCRSRSAGFAAVTCSRATKSARWS